MAALRKQATARSSARQFSFRDREDSLDQRATAIFLAREVGAHLRANAMNVPGLFPALGGDNAQSLKLLTDEGVVTLGIELGIGQHATDRSESMGLRHQSRQVSACPAGHIVDSLDRGHS